MLTICECRFKKCPIEIVGMRKPACVPATASTEKCRECVLGWLNEENGQTKKGDRMNDNQKKFLTEFIDLMERYNISNVYATKEIVLESNGEIFKIRSYSRHNDGVTFVDTFGGAIKWSD